MLEGELWVDANTSVVLKAQLQGALKLPEGEATSKVHIHLATRMENIGQNPQLKIPDTFIPDEDKPQGIAAALERFGLGRKTRTEADSAPVPPDEE
jgi:predicted GNAT family acetyltransferase